MSKRQAPAVPFVIGLVGGVAAGKTQVAEAFQAAGAARIDADQIAHDVLDKPLIARRITQLFGDAILQPGGKVDRTVLGRIVFAADAAGKAARRKLEDVVHPVIHAEAVQQLRRLQENEPPPLAVVIDAPLLLEVGWAPMCDAILYVDTPYETRQGRAISRGWTKEQFESREASQLMLDRKRQRSTHIVSGDLNAADLTAYCQAFLEQIAANSQ